MLTPFLELLEVRHNEEYGIFTFVADHYDLGDKLVGFDFVLDRLRGDILSTRSDDDILLTIRNCEKPVAQLANVSGMQPSVRVDRLSRGIRVIEITLHNVRATGANLTVR